MQILIVSASSRKNSQSLKVAQFIEKRFAALDPSDVKASVYSLEGNPLPLWDEGVWDKTPEWQKIWTPVSEKLKAAEAFVFVVPEWGGMVPPQFKNFLLLTGKEMAHKPVLLVTVSAGMGGAYPISELRASGYKNTYLSYLPEHIIIRYAEKMLNEGPAVDENEQRMRDRIDHELKLLKVYGQAYKGIRENTEVDVLKYPSGM